MSSRPFPNYSDSDGGSPVSAENPENPDNPGMEVAESARLTPLEVEVIDLFVNAVKIVGIPKSVGEIYGLLFVAPEPLSLDALVERLQISKGSASQGLRFLRNLGAVKSVYVAGNRRDHFSAETELKRLASGFMKGELQPHIENGEVRLARLEDLAQELIESPGGDFYGERIQKLSVWHKQARRLLPLVQKFLT